MTYDQFKIFSEHQQLIHGFTHRSGGVAQTPFGNQHMGILSGLEIEAAWENIKALCHSFETPVNALVMTEQVHKDKLETVKLSQCKFNETDGFKTAVLSATDGVFTNEKGVLLLTFYADCTPIYFYDTTLEVIGMVHSGWRGTALKVAQKGIEHMVNQFGSRRSDIKVVIGPCAGDCCYEVDDYVKEHFNDYESFFKPTAVGHYLMDLKGINHRILLDSGLTSTQIEVSSNCTLCETQRYFSYRNENGKTGRMAAFMMLKA